MTDEKNELSEILGLLKANQDESSKKLLESERLILKLNQDVENEKGTVLKLNQDLEAKNKIISDLQGEIGTLKQKAVDEKLSRIKANQESFWNGLPEGIKEKFAARKEELSDSEMSFKLNQDITAAILAIPKPEFMKAEGSTDVKNNQDTELDEVSSIVENLKSTKRVIRND
jgi:hypothetical protein